MRLTGGVLAGSILAATAGPAQAEDWRAASLSHHDVVFVDADSVRRQRDGRIAFRARHRLAQNDSNRDFGYDRIDLSVTGRCQAPGPDLPPAGSVRKYFLRNKAVAAPEWREPDIVEDSAGLAETVCRGFIGYRSFADLDRAMSEYDDHDSLERLAAFVTGEMELTGIVVQGWEMNVVSLCGEDSCREAPPKEFCWLDGGINVPAPAGAAEWVDGGPRRDSAGAAFKGRIHRARGGNGFGHMGGFACLVEVTGPVRFVAVPARPEERQDDGGPGLRPEAAAAHEAFVAAVRSAAKVGLAMGSRRWEVDDFKPGSSGGACYSLPSVKDPNPNFPAPALGWPGLQRMIREGNAITLVDRDWDPDLTFHFPDPKAAAASEGFLRKLASGGVAAISQKRAKVSIRYSNGRGETFRFQDPAAAVRAAGMAARLRGREIAGLKRETNRVTATPLRRVSLIFPDESSAQRVHERMETLRAACARKAS